jgi:TRAP-type C4-dicarboxylate transport system substrate-binding protein
MFRALFFLLALALTPDSLQAAGQVFNFRMSGVHSLMHPAVQRAILPWAARVRLRTGGRVNIMYVNPDTLGPEIENFDLVRKGALDIGHNALARNAGRFLVSTVVDIPGGPVSPAAASVAMWRIYNETPDINLEFGAVKLLALHSSSPLQFIWTIDADITRSAQIKGKKILAPNGQIARMVRNFGGNPLIMPVADFALSFSRGMAEGCALPLVEVNDYKLFENVKSVTLGGLSSSGYWIAMNRAAWDSLPAEFQKIIEEESGEKLSYLCGRAIAEGEDEALPLLQQQKVRLNPVSREEKAEWLRLTAPAYQEEWFRKMERRNLPAQRIFDQAQRINQECAGIGMLPYSY